MHAVRLACPVFLTQFLAATAVHGALQLGVKKHCRLQQRAVTITKFERVSHKLYSKLHTTWSRPQTYLGMLLTQLKLARPLGCAKAVAAPQWMQWQRVGASPARGIPGNMYWGCHTSG